MVDDTPKRPPSVTKTAHHLRRRKCLSPISSAGARNGLTVTDYPRIRDRASCRASAKMRAQKVTCEKLPSPPRPVISEVVAVHSLHGGAFCRIATCVLSPRTWSAWGQNWPLLTIWRAAAAVGLTISRCDFNGIGVCSFILSDAPSANRTATALLMLARGGPRSILALAIPLTTA